jgi:hypothetical protein
MNRLLSGTALIAALVIAAPVWAADAPLSPEPVGARLTADPVPYTGLSTPSAGQIPEPSAGASMEPRRHVIRRAPRGRHAGHMRMPGARSSAPNDNIADRLNAEQLGRAGGGGPPRGMTGPYGGP